MANAGACVVPAVANCLQVADTSATTCAVCDQGFSLTVDGQCVPCLVGCLECADGVNGTASCHRCKQNLYPDPANPGSCVPAAVANCLQVSEASATVCAVCDQAFSLTVDGQCVPCKTGCVVCADGAAGPDTCLRCVQGLYPDVTNAGACVVPAVANCLQVVDTSATTCAVCDLGYSLDVTGQCVPCKTGCLECADGAAGPDTCLRCKQTVYPDPTDPGACVPSVIANCATPSATSAAVCDVCQPFYTPSINATECLVCPSGCAQCHVTMLNALVCDVCVSDPTATTFCQRSICPTNLQTDPFNCGNCGIVCPTGSMCSAGVCICTDTGQPVVAALPATCGTSYRGAQAATTYEYAVTPGATYAANYDSFSVPDRFVVRYDSPCGPVVYDTSFTGLVSSGCAASAPCCVSGPGCTGTAGQFCPPNGGGGGPPGGQGAGTIPDQVIPVNTTKLYATAFGVCGGTANTFQLSGAGGGACPP